ncbi:hypothetical protein HCN44_000866 [Aphidius gifuensis]|uniref:Uncharacterized protein n=1 Tax=Aphidius gifuensis TaxID=684658 RepID=A0A834Y3P3_APHGI|nr:hypothetical protein HCN44_000866 [Aphidius gifuensis]
MYKFRVLKEELSKCRFDNSRKIRQIQISIEHELEKFKEAEKLQFSLWQETYINNKTNNEIENEKEKEERHLLHEIMAFSNDVKQLKSRLAFYSA